MQNTYADIDTDISKLLHGVARLHVALGRMSDAGITTRVGHTIMSDRYSF